MPFYLRHTSLSQQIFSLQYFWLWSMRKFSSFCAHSLVDRFQLELVVYLSARNTFWPHFHVTVCISILDFLSQSGTNWIDNLHCLSFIAAASTRTANAQTPKSISRTKMLVAERALGSRIGFVVCYSFDRRGIHDFIFSLYYIRFECNGMSVVRVDRYEGISPLLASVKKRRKWFHMSLKSIWFDWICSMCLNTHSFVFCRIHTRVCVSLPKHFYSRFSETIFILSRRHTKRAEISHLRFVQSFRSSF